MTDRHPDRRMPPWDAAPLKQRLVDCLTQLAVDQMLTHAEQAKVRERIKKWLDKNQGVPYTPPPVLYAEHVEGDRGCGCASCMGVA